MKFALFFSVLFLGTQNIVAQKDTLNTKKIIKLDEVVVSAQIEPQSVKKSIKNVQVISQQQIKNLGATNLGDVLNQYINITVVPDVNSGGSTVSLFGLDGSYFKILVDNVPLVNENGFGNNTDLSQINLDDIERIEIIEGSMGVTHGANAVSGILNIITKRKANNKWDILYSAQEESIGKEYNFTDKGRHIQSVKISHNLTENWMITAGTVRNKNNGFFDDFGGKNVLSDTQKRGYKFLPRTNIQTNALLNYKKNNFNAFYKFELMNQDVSFFNRNVQSGYGQAYGAYKYGNDRRLYYDRQFHHLNFNGTSFINYNLSFSYQKQTREEEKFRYIINHRKEINNERKKAESMQVFYSKGDFAKSFYDKKLALSLGYEITLNNGFAIVSAPQNRTKEINANLDNYDAFLVSEYHFTDNFSISAGGRYSWQSLFENQNSLSFGTRYLLPYNIEWRASLGKSFRTPSFEELYSEVIFSNHYVVGNPDLLPENSLSLDTSFKKTTSFANGTMLKNQISLSRNRIKDWITRVRTGTEGGTPIYKNINVSEYKYINLATTNNVLIHNFDINLGASFTWSSQLIDTYQYQTDDRVFLNVAANLGVTYKIPKWDASVSAYYKWKGKTQEWVTLFDNYAFGNIDTYDWLDVSAKKTFFNKNLELILGVRNVLNIIDVRTSLDMLGREYIRNTPLGNGRTFFVKLAYNLNINY
ncbi:MAG: TonB-dependent receptor [Capnocytophaga sp.]|nr:TonB-dependent receptor [Capnocytophaga sp.]